jgi:hypothetical protein
MVIPNKIIYYCEGLNNEYVLKHRNINQNITFLDIINLQINYMLLIIQIIQNRIKIIMNHFNFL